MEKKAWKKWKIGTLIVAITVLSFSPLVQAATEAEIELAIKNGLGWLAPEQEADGSWQYNSGWPDPSMDVSTTSLVLSKLVDRAKELKRDPFDADPSSPTYYEYANNVKDGFDYLFTQAAIDINGIHFGPLWSDTYSTGTAMMALAASNAPARVIGVGPLAGMTFKQAVQGMLNWMVFAQNTETGVCETGGWGYGAPSPGWSDNSNSGYASLGVGSAAAKPPYGFDLPTPATIIIGLDTFIDNVQVAGGDYLGGSLYNPCWGMAPGWVNILKTGNLLHQLAMVGDIDSDARPQNAIGFIEKYWANFGGECDGCGWKGDYQAMFTLMKGLEAYGIETLHQGAKDIDWFDEVSTYIVTNQNPAGWWLSTNGEGRTPTLNTAWALLTLEKAVQKVEFGIPDQCIPAGGTFAGFDADDYVVIGTPPYSWTWAGEVNLSVAKDSENVFTITYPPAWTGNETITFTATDANNKTSNDNATYTVDPVPVVGNIPDQTAPFIPFDLDDYLSGIAPPAVTWSYAGNSCLVVSMDAGNVVTITNPGDVCTASETITFTATATACGEKVTDSDPAVFTPNRPPVCSAAYANPGCLWPPNNQMVGIGILGVIDPDNNPITLIVNRITSDEATASDKGSGGPKHAPDATGIGTGKAQVRSERSGTADGRVYVVNFTANDGHGGECTGKVAVKVPHDQSSKNCPAIDSGQKYDATQIN